MTTSSEISMASSPASLAAAPRCATTDLRELLAFKPGAEEYGIDILREQDIRSCEEPTRIVIAPAFVEGAVNRRGVIVPVVDMRPVEQTLQ